MRTKFLEGMSRAASSVTLVTTDGRAGRGGITVSAMTSVSADSDFPSLLVCVNASSRCASLIERNGIFCVNLLNSAQVRLSDIFAGRVQLPDGDRFSCTQWHIMETGAPALQDALASFDCFLTKALEYASHRVFFGEVRAVALNEPSQALLYSNRMYGQPVPLS